MPAILENPAPGNDAARNLAAKPKPPAKIAVRAAGFSLRTKFTALTAGLFFILMGLVLYFVYSQESDALGRVVRERGATIARNLAANASEFFFPVRDELQLPILVKGAVQEGESSDADTSQYPLWQEVYHDLMTPATQAPRNLGVVEAFICDRANTIVAHSQISLTGQNYVPPPYIEPVSDRNPFPTYLFRGRPCYDISVPLQPKGTDQVLGTVHIGLRRDIIDRRVRVAATKLVAVILAMLLAGILFTVILVGSLLRPVGPLVRGVEAVARGDFGQYIKKAPRDELGDLVEAYNGMAKSLGENETLKEAFSHYTSSALMAEVLSDPSKAAKLGGERRQATVLFSLLHGVHEISETMDAMAFVELLNEYLTVQTEAIPRHGGHIDKYVREEVMAVWGVPAANPDHAFQAVAAAVEMQANVKKLNLARGMKGKQTLEISIGLNTGEVISGNMGSAQKFDFTVIGDTVNTAARLMASGKNGHVLVSQATFDLVKDKVDVESLEPIKVKGKKEPLQVYHVKSVKE